MRVLISGDRNWREALPIYNTLLELSEKHEDLTVIQGEARGADTYAEVCCQLLGIPTEAYPADWNTHGRAAGPIRNQQMLDTGIDLVIGFHPHIMESRGTRDMLTRAYKAGVKTIWHNGREGVDYPG